MRKLLRFLRPYKRQMILGPLAKLIEAVLELLLPFLMASLIDVGLKNSDLDYVYRQAIIMLVFSVVGIASSLFCQYSAAQAGFGFGKGIRCALLKKVYELDYAQIKTYSQSTISNRLSADVSQAEQGVAMFIRLFLRAPFLCVGGIVMAIVLDAKLSLVLLFFVPLFAFVAVIIMKKNIPAYKQAQGKLDEATTLIGEDISGFRTVRAYTAEQARERKFLQANNSLKKAQARAAIISACLSPVTTFIMNVAVLVVLIIAGRFTGLYPSGKLVAFVSYINQILAAFLVAANLSIIFFRAEASAQRINEILDLQPQNSFGDIEQVDFDSPVVINVKNLSYAYGSDGYVLKNINLQIKNGEKVGIIGGTGSGKSTLCKLLMRELVAENGTICLFEQDIRQLSQQFLQKNVIMTEQMPKLFLGTIRQNIALGCDFDDEQILRACESAQIANMIRRSSKGLDTIVKRGGANFSGGQKQRLIVARAILFAPKIMILDDCASALDNLTDYNIRHELQKMQLLAQIVVAQKISAVKDLDRIFVLDKGKIVDSGTHQQLLESCAIYAQICQSQQGGGANEQE